MNPNQPTPDPPSPDEAIMNRLKSYRWKGPVFAVTAINGNGCRELTFRIQDWLDAHPAYASAPEPQPNDATPVVVSPAPVRQRRPRMPADK